MIWDSNLGLQNGRRRRNHGAMVAIIYCKFSNNGNIIDNEFSEFVSRYLADYTHGGGGVGRWLELIMHRSNEKSNKNSSN